jgi:magnesium-protoporphyrin O-methyltransferase
VSGCCRPESYERLFGARQARLDARRYRLRGLRGTARDLVELADDVAGTTVLDVGGGVGAIELELLAAGAERATSVELSGEYEGVAAELLAERGLSERVDRRVGDFVMEPVEPHDVVVMHRVVCCYPDVDALVGAGAACARRRLLLTYPQERPWTRAGVRAINFFMRLNGSDFRAFVHPVQRMTAAARGRGLELATRRRRGIFWESAAFERLHAGGAGNGPGMEPRHLEGEAEQRAAERAAEATEETRARRGDEDPRGEQVEEGGDLEHRTPPEDDETWI